MLQPAPAATPLTAATTGKGRLAQFAHQRIVMRLLRGAEHDGFARLGQPVVEVLPGAEAAAGAGDHERAAAFVGFGLVDRRAQRQMHRLVEGVEPVRPVEGDDAIAGAPFDQDGCIVHSQWVPGIPLIAPYQ